MISTGIQPGVYCAALTPFTDDYRIDTDLLVRHCRWLLLQGCKGICLGGTTGEANSISLIERQKMLEAVVEGGVDPEKLLVGTGCCALNDTVQLTRHALDMKVAGVLVLPPFYYQQISDEGLRGYFSQFIEKVGAQELKLYLYHFPKLTGIHFSHNLLRQLTTAYPEIVKGLKDSSGDWEHMRSVVLEFPDFQVFSGTEKYLLDILKIGGSGCISATVNLTASLAASLFDVYKEHQANQLQENLTAIRNALEIDPVIPALKYLLSNYTQSSQWLQVMPPHLPLSDRQAASLNSRWSAVNFDPVY